MIPRLDYLNKLILFKDKQVIKVLTGIRFSGKFTILKLYIQYLLEHNIDKKQIIYINVNKFKNVDYKSIYRYIKEKLFCDKMNYIFINNLDNLINFEKLINGLFLIKNVDIYISGILSSELATLLSGRYIEIKMLPLSFKEYISYLGESDLLIKYNRYITTSSFPYVLNLNTKNEIRTYLEGIYNTIIIKDVASRKKIADASMLNDIVKFMFSSVGNLCSSNKIANAMTSNGRKISVPTVESYLSALVDSFILYKVNRYDIRGKQYLSSLSKYYLSDIGLRYYLLGSKEADEGHILENIVYLELLRRGYEVYVGKTDNAEVDFVAINEKGEEYYQVSYTVRDEKTLNRELKALDDIHDHNPKYLLTMDFTPYTSYNGIKQINVLEWLLDKNN